MLKNMVKLVYIFFIHSTMANLFPRIKLRFMRNLKYQIKYLGTTDIVQQDK